MFQNFQKYILKGEDSKEAAPILSLPPAFSKWKKKKKRGLGATAATGNKRKVRTIRYVTCGQIFCKTLPKNNQDDTPEK